MRWLPIQTLVGKNLPKATIIYDDGIDDYLENNLLWKNSAKSRELCGAFCSILVRQNEEKKEAVETEISVLRKSANLLVASERKKLIKALEKQMEEYADCLAFEQAAAVRD